MGILDRIAGTLDELTGDADAAEIARADELATSGALDEAEAALVALTARAPRGAAAFRALGRVRSRRR